MQGNLLLHMVCGELTHEPRGNASGDPPRLELIDQRMDGSALTGQLRRPFVEHNFPFAGRDLLIALIQAE